MKKIRRIRKLFDERDTGEKIMSLFITAGFPQAEHTVELMLEIEAAGADIIELGMPFSDPLADGPTIQYAGKVALDQGVHLDVIFDMVSEFRRHSELPVVLMGYINPVLRYGLKAFFSKANKAGVDGVILPDAPPGALPAAEKEAASNGVDIIYLVAPNTSDERMREIDKASGGFVYCVSVTGVTGVRDGSEVSRSVDGYIQRVRKNVTKNPVLVGFGIRSHKDAMKISRDVDGFIAGSAVIDFIRNTYPDDDWIRKTAGFVRNLKTGEDPDPVA